MKRHTSARASRHKRRIGGRAQDPDIGDPYQARHKPAGPTVCSECAAVFQEGHWSWRAPLSECEETICPACHRIRDKYPAGSLTLKGRFVQEHKAEILRLARHNEELEKQEHPLNRIMEIEEKDEGVVISTTDIHLPRRIGEALYHAYRGQLAFRYDKDSYFIRVDWARED
jgi:hypothetical protein